MNSIQRMRQEDLTIKLKLAPLDLLENLFIARSSEGRVTAQENVENDSARPHVALLVIAPREDLGCNIVRLRRFNSRLIEFLTVPSR